MSATGPEAGPPFFEVVLTQRACREYADTPLDDASVATVLRAATHAPSAENKQPWEFVVVRDPATQQAIHDLTEAAWTAGGRAFSEARLTPDLLAEVDRGYAGGGYRSAPVLVVVCADVERGLPVTVGSSIFPCVQNLLLAAHALGLGSALTTLGAQAGPSLQDLLGLPDHVVPQAVVPLGFPARRLGPPKRDDVAAHTHRDRYANPW
ncbi:MAG: nitroreductase family protein [Actinomycetes bacterium]